MDEHAGLHVGLVVYMEVAASAGDASAGERAVVPKVGHQDRLGLADAIHPAPQLVALLRSGHAAEVGI